MDKKKLKNSLYFLAISLVIMLYVIFIVEPFCSTNGVYSEGSPMDSGTRIILCAMTMPTILAYLSYVLKNYRELKYFNFLNYPLAILNSCFLLALAFLSATGYGLYIIFLIFPILVSIMSSVFVMIFGLIKDIKSWKEYIKLEK